MLLRIVFAVALAAFPGVAQPRSAPRDQAHSQRKTTRAAAPRSTAARRTFQQVNPCPSTGRPTGACPGYVVDHVIALKRGGPDDPSNMQWQTVAEARANDKIE
jgi:hypothetical protein